MASVPADRGGLTCAHVDAERDVLPVERPDLANACWRYVERLPFSFSTQPVLSRQSLLTRE